MATRNADTFEKRFKPKWVKPDDREPLGIHELSEPIDSSHLWTLVDPMVPSGMQYWLPGYHFVNREGYVFTEVPWTEADLQDEYRRW